MVGTIAEYIILAFNILFLVYTLYLEKKVLKNDPKASEKLIKSKEFFVYLEQPDLQKQAENRVRANSEQENLLSATIEEQNMNVASDKQKLENSQENPQKKMQKKSIKEKKLVNPSKKNKFDYTNDESWNGIENSNIKENTVKPQFGLSKVYY